MANYLTHKKIPAGTWAIENLAFKGRFVILKDRNAGTALLTTGSTEPDNAKWEINKINENFQYTVQSPTNDGNFAKAHHEGVVQGRPNPFTWTITRTPTVDVYHIYDSDNDLYWYLENANNDTKVRLSADANTDKVKWKFIRKEL